MNLYELLSSGEFVSYEAGKFKERMFHGGRLAIEYYADILKQTEPQYSRVIVLDNVIRAHLSPRGVNRDDQLVGYIPADWFWELVGPDDVAVGPVFYQIEEDARVSLYIPPNPIGWFTDGRPGIFVFRGGFGSYPYEEGVWVFAPSDFWRFHSEWLDALAIENELLRTIYVTVLRYFAEPEDRMFKPPEFALPYLRRLFGMRGDRLVLWEWWQATRYISFMGYGERLPIMILELAMNGDLSAFPDIISVVEDFDNDEVGNLALSILFIPIMMSTIDVESNTPTWISDRCTMRHGNYVAGLLKSSEMLSVPGAEVAGGFLYSSIMEEVRLFVAPRLFGYNHVMHGPVAYSPKAPLPPYLRLACPPIDEETLLVKKRY